MHQIWVIVDDKGKLRTCWEAAHPSNPKKPEEPPIVKDPMPPDWKIIKINPPWVLEMLKQAAQRDGKTLSRIILEECKVDPVSRPERPKELPPGILYREIIWTKKG